MELHGHVWTCTELWNCIELHGIAWNFIPRNTIRPKGMVGKNPWGLGGPTGTKMGLSWKHIERIERDFFHETSFPLRYGPEVSDRIDIVLNEFPGKELLRISFESKPERRSEPSVMYSAVDRSVRSAPPVRPLFLSKRNILRIG